VEAIRLGGRLEGLVLDPVYSRKCLAGLIALTRERRWVHDDHVVFVHTGGAPALFADLPAVDSGLPRSTHW
jgi:1-aminocyclopropane-1-carboxylate deaminase/D-cysteine desulfhydrase-like pyridoxal-dependent ACC family enzyme